VSLIFSSSFPSTIFYYQALCFSTNCIPFLCFSLFISIYAFQAQQLPSVYSTIFLKTFCTGKKLKQLSSTQFFRRKILRHGKAMDLGSTSQSRPFLSFLMIFFCSARYQTQDLCMPGKHFTPELHPQSRT
jgi:hypothetical protein